MKAHRTTSDGRYLFVWKGKNQTEDLNRLTEAVADLCVAELFELNGGLHWLDGEQLIPITKDILRGIIVANFAGVRLVDRGDGSWEREFYSYEFPLTSDTTKEPNERTLIDMCAALLDRVVKGPSTLRELPEPLHQAARYRLKTGEPASRIAASYNVGVEAIQRLAR